MELGELVVDAPGNGLRRKGALLQRAIPPTRTAALFERLSAAAVLDGGREGAARSA
jgi:hypothetical protein